MKVNVSKQRVKTRLRLIEHDRYICPWCWAEYDHSCKCICGMGEVKKERNHIVLRSEI